MLEKKLLSIGLSEKEIQVYLNSLKFGYQPASVIAAHTGLNRTTIYDIFEQLIKKGLANKMKKGSTSYFQVMDPKNLLSYLEREKNEKVRAIERQKEDISLIIPALQSLQNPLSSKPKVQFYEGEKGVREAYEDTLSSAEPIRSYANVEGHGYLPHFFPDYYKRRAAAGIKIYAIFPDNDVCLERRKHDKKELRESRVLPKEKYNFSPQLDVYEDKVLIASWLEKTAVIVKSKEIADLHKKIFDALWERLR